MDNKYKVYRIDLDIHAVREEDDEYYYTNLYVIAGDDDTAVDLAADFAHEKWNPPYTRRGSGIRFVGCKEVDPNEEGRVFGWKHKKDERFVKKDIKERYDEEFE